MYYSFGGGFGTAAAVFGAPAAAPAFASGAYGGGIAKGTGQPAYRDTQERGWEWEWEWALQTFTYKSITKMSEYAGKSFEQLRCEDYAKGNTGEAGSSTAAGGFTFGTPPPRSESARPSHSPVVSPRSAAPCPCSMIRRRLAHFP